VVPCSKEERRSEAYKRNTGRTLNEKHGFCASRKGLKVKGKKNPDSFYTIGISYHLLNLDIN